MRAHPLTTKNSPRKPLQLSPIINFLQTTISSRLQIILTGNRQKLQKAIIVKKGESLETIEIFSLPNI